MVPDQTTDVKKTVIESAASRSVPAMLCTTPAADLGWVMMKKMMNARTRNPTTLLMSTTCRSATVSVEH